MEAGVTIVFYLQASGRSPVEEFIDALPEKDQAKIAWTIDLLTKHGMNLPQPYLKRLAGTKNLWELRIAFGGKAYRIFLSPIPPKRNILLHAIVKKKQKTPTKDIETAENRLHDFLKRSIA